MTSGTAGTGVACTGVYKYDVGAQDYSVVTNYLTRTQRQCRWCHAARASTTADVHLKDFNPPTTSARTLSGITVLATTTAGAGVLTDDSTPTSTKQESVVVGSGGCGAAGQTTKKNTKGQSVSFTMKLPVALAYGQHVFWQDVTGTPVNFQITGNTPANSVSCTCGTTTWTTILTKDGNGLRMKLTLPSKPNSATTEVYCAKGDLSCTAREWSSGSATVTDMTASCYACDSGSGSCTKEQSAATG
jgi:hypothetical protein